MLKNFKEIYLLGLRWLLNIEFITQAIYIGITIDMISIIFLKKMSTVYIIMLIIHIISMYLLGYQKDSWELSPKEKVYQNLYFGVNIIILILTLVITKSLTSILVLLVPTIATLIITILIYILTFILYKLTNSILNLIYKISGKVLDSEKFYQKIWICMCSILMLLFAIPVLHISLHIIYKIVIILAYYISIPLIVYGEDNGMNFYSLFSKCDYDVSRKLGEQEKEHSNLD